MKTYVTFTNGHMQVENMQEAIEVANERENVNFIVQIDETKLPEDVRVEDCIVAEECEFINRTYNW